MVVPRAQDISATSDVMYFVFSLFVKKIFNACTFFFKEYEFTINYSLAKEAGIAQLV